MPSTQHVNCKIQALRDVTECTMRKFGLRLAFRSTAVRGHNFDGQNRPKEFFEPAAKLIHAVETHDAPIDEWAKALSALWDDPANYQRLAAAALRHSERQEIQPEAIVSEFISAVSAFAGSRRSASVA